MDNKKTIISFCAGEQKDTEHTVDIDNSGEIILTCINDQRTEEQLKDNESTPILCGRFIKYPKGTSAEKLKGHLVEHKKANEGQLSQESIEAEKAKIVDALVS